MYNNDSSKNYSNNTLFLDIINKINIDAKSKGFINGKEWLSEAQKCGEVTPIEFNKFQSCHYLRNIIAHGGGGQVIITDESINAAQTFLTRITVSGLMRTKDGVVRTTPAKAATAAPVTTVQYVTMSSAAPAEPEGPKLGDVKKKFERLKIINDPANAVMVELKKSLAEGLRSFKEYEKLPKADIENMVIDMLCTCPDDEFKEMQKAPAPKPKPAPAPVPTEPTLTEIKQTVIKNLIR